MKFMTKIFTVLFLSTIAVTASAHSYHQASSVTFEVPTFSNCSVVTAEACPEYKQYLLGLLLQLIQAIEEAREASAEAAEENPSGTNRVIVNLTDQEIDRFKDSTYRVLSNGKLSGESRGDVPEVVVSLWNDFKVIAGEEIIDEFVISIRAYYDEDDYTAAYVETDNDDYTKWILGLNVADYVNDTSANKENYFQVLIHEFAHILTLNNDQLDLTSNERSCGTYNPGEGCLYANSYLYQFVDEFWERGDFRVSDRVDEEEDQEKRDEITEEYYENNDDEFVSAYAITNPAEDIAESFAYYVYADIPEEVETEIDEKFLFFEGIMELREIRNTIRSTFTDIF